jgi:hypothetical protein
MTRLLCGLLTVALCFIFSCNRSLQTPEAVEHKSQAPAASPQTKPANTGFVQDEQAAIEIAVRAWVPIYGKEQIEKEKTYQAELKHGVWTVTGSLPEGRDGGVAIARISQTDGRVLETGHSK